MSLPSAEELETALREAGRMRETGEDPHFLAKALLNCHYQSQFLQEVLLKAETYLRSGLSEQEHARLVQAIARAREAQLRSAKKESPPLSL